MIDDFCKQLVARHPASIGRWLLGLTAAPKQAQAEAETETDAAQSGPHWQLLDRELSSDPLHADSVILHLAVGRTRHHFSSPRLWEQDPAPWLADPALLPLAVLARPPASAREQLLSQVRQQLQTIPDPDQRRRTTSGCQLLAGLSFSQGVIQRLLAMSILEDSSVYQYIVRKGLEEGRALGLQEGRPLGCRAPACHPRARSASGARQP